MKGTGDLAAGHEFGGGRHLSVLVSGSSGLVGQAIVAFLESRKYTVGRLVRQGSGSVYWDPARGVIDRASLVGFDAVIHLAGEGVAGGRWTAEKKARIYTSRVEGTRLLAGALAGCQRPPRVMLCASAVGFYGDRGDERLSEESGPGRGFLAQVCAAWEGAAAAARQAGIRVVHLRLGVVLSAAGGALARLLLPFRLGFGGVVGSGSQYVSWIDMDDVVGIFHYALKDETLAGPVNAVAPGAVTNRQLTRALGRVLRRPTILRLPASVVRLALGEMGEALLVASARVEPARLLAAGYEFLYPTIEGALSHLLGARP